MPNQIKQTKFRLNATAAINHLSSSHAMQTAQWLQNNRPSTIWITCATCHHIAKHPTNPALLIPAFCTKYNVTPPVAVIVGDTYCEGYSDHAEIPF